MTTMMHEHVHSDICVYIPMFYNVYSNTIIPMFLVCAVSQEHVHSDMLLAENYNGTYKWSQESLSKSSSSSVAVLHPYILLMTNARWLPGAFMHQESSMKL
jgi:hypothetical protein